jgi:hypothetical protein
MIGGRVVFGSPVFSVFLVFQDSIEPMISIRSIAPRYALLQQAQGFS